MVNSMSNFIINHILNSDPDTNIPEGMGIMLYFEKPSLLCRELFEGWFLHGKLQGHGRWKRHDRHVYIGDFVDGQKTGSGKYMWPSGAWQEGFWIDGLMNGTGKYHYRCGDEYEGEWKDD
jgi:hypothetical protein